MQNRIYANNEFKTIGRTKLNMCKYCDSGNISKKDVRKNKKGNVQVFKCLKCTHKFTTNFGFEKTHVNETIMASTMQMSFTKMSVRYIPDHYELQDIKIAYRTTYNWIARYSKMVSKYLGDSAKN